MWKNSESESEEKKSKDAHGGGGARQTHVGSYGAALGKDDGQIEEGSSEEQASSTHERISTWRFLPQALTDCSTHSYTQHSRHTCDDTKIQTRENRGRVLELSDTMSQEMLIIMCVNVKGFLLLCRFKIQELSHTVDKRIVFTNLEMSPWQQYEHCVSVNGVEDETVDLKMTTAMH